MRAITLSILALLAAGCAGDPEEAGGETNYGDTCPEDTSAYHDAATGGEASTDPPPEPVPPEDRLGGPYCPGTLGDTDESTKQTIEE